MMPSPPIDDRIDTRPSGRLPAGSAQACASTPDWSAVASPISSHTMRSTRSHRRAYPYLAESRSLQALRSNLLKPYPVAKSP